MTRRRAAIISASSIGIGLGSSIDVVSSERSRLEQLLPPVSSSRSNGARPCSRRSPSRSSPDVAASRSARCRRTRPGRRSPTGNPLERTSARPGRWRRRGRRGESGREAARRRRASASTRFVAASDVAPHHRVGTVGVASLEVGTRDAVGEERVAGDQRPSCDQQAGHVGRVAGEREAAAPIWRRATTVAVAERGDRRRRCHGRSSPRACEASRRSRRRGHALLRGGRRAGACRRRRRCGRRARARARRRTRRPGRGRRPAPARRRPARRRGSRGPDAGPAGHRARRCRDRPRGSCRVAIQPRIPPSTTIASTPSSRSRGATDCAVTPRLQRTVTGPQGAAPRARPRRPARVRRGCGSSSRIAPRSSSRHPRGRRAASAACPAPGARRARRR